MLHSTATFRDDVLVPGPLQCEQVMKKHIVEFVSVYVILIFKKIEVIIYYYILIER